MNKLFFFITLAIVLTSIALTYYFTKLSIEDSMTGSQKRSGEKHPLYWVAPMDPNYRRDEPGKSPMGMDLVPVYQEEGNSRREVADSIFIAPHVVHNLGVRTALAKKQNLNTEITTVGYVKYDEDNLIHVHPRVEGWIEKLHIKASGDPVKKNQPLYTLYSPQLVNTQEELIIALHRGDKTLIDAAENRLRSFQVEESLIKELKSKGVVHRTLIFRAPQSGVVDNLKIREGFFVKPSMTLMSIGTLNPIWVEAEVFERQATQVKVGLPVVMTLDHGSTQDWPGQVDYVYPTVDLKNRTVRVRLRFQNPDEILKPNMFAQVRIQLMSRDDVLAVPRQAVIRTGQQNRVVLDLGEGSFKSVAVEIGSVHNDFAEITHGLVEGDRVVISAQFLLDSESSKTSDFKRMSHKSQNSAAENDNPQDDPQMVWVEALVHSVNPSERTINVDHEAIEVWSWPKMRMDLKLTQSIDLSLFKVGMSLHIQISKVGSGGEQYLITEVHIPDDHNDHDHHNSHIDEDAPNHSNMNDDVDDDNHHQHHHH